jgi:hypothetical protein
MTDEKATMQIRDDLAVKEHYVNKFVGSAFDGGALTLTFGSIRLVAAKTGEGTAADQVPEVYITERLTLSRSAAIELAKALNMLFAPRAPQNSAQTAAHTRAH